MINNTIFIANITRYYNYLKRPHNWHKTPVETLPTAKLLGLLRRHYENTGNFIYEIDKPE